MSTNRGKPSEQDVADIRGSILRMGEFRVHLIWAPKSGGCTARMWHPGGWKIGHATGYGYDKGGAALGQAISLFFAPELRKVPARTAENPDGCYGVRHYEDRSTLDGACGLESMLKILSALGFASVEGYETHKDSYMILATGRKPEPQT